MTIRLLGSSPLARGLPLRMILGRLCGRIIPARAGFTCEDIVESHVGSDHPRSRGVYKVGDGHGDPLVGSSPLARGLQRPVDRPGGLRGIIPARAGFTPEGRRPLRMIADHPRSRGVYAVHIAVQPPHWGSSPLARGLRSVFGGPSDRDGIIPARAGFTTGPHCTCLPPWDHPRSRGVYGGKPGVALEVRGSSPLARGLRRHQAVHGGGPRIIPARAGFTRTSGMLVSLYEDHPRSCRVYRYAEHPEAAVAGSSPLARGLQGTFCGVGAFPGIIPARAGFTAEQYKDWLTHTGSSPLARGLLTPVLGPPC